MMTMIDKNAGVPVYQQLKERLLEAITKGELPAGKRIPSENELSRRYGIHRHTVRNSLRQMAEEGILHSVPGSGWFVKPNEKKRRPVILINSPKEPDTKGTYSTFAERIRSGFQTGAEHYDFELHYQERQQVELFLQGQPADFEPAALILTDYRPDWNEFLQELKRSRLPLLFANRQIFGADIPCIAIDQYYGTRDLVTRLTQAGHRRIGCITSDLPLRYLSERFRGYYDALAAAGIELDKKLVCPIKDSKVCHDQIRELIQQNPDITGLFIAGEVFHQQTFEVLRELKRSIPDDLSVTAFDRVKDHPVGIVALEQPLEQLGMRLFKVLDDMLNGKKVAGEVLQPTIIHGGSIKCLNQTN